MHFAYSNLFLKLLGEGRERECVYVCMCMGVYCELVRVLFELDAIKDLEW